IKTGGFLGMFRKRKLEVLAAVEPNAAKQEPKATKKLADDQVDLVIEQILKASQRSKTQQVNKETVEQVSKVKEEQQQTTRRARLDEKLASEPAVTANNFASR